ncbi:MAG: hypothetical protein FWE37_05120 [Spirochaetaceae bacterium]|nr:hypothetical protein [Spirochaetaceae bacterium]
MINTNSILNFANGKQYSYTVQPLRAGQEPLATGQVLGVLQVTRQKSRGQSGEVTNRNIFRFYARSPITAAGGNIALNTEEYGDIRLVLNYDYSTSAYMPHVRYDGELAREYKEAGGNDFIS